MAIKKTYINVIAEFGVHAIIPLSFIWPYTGQCFNIDRVIDVRNAPSLKAGGAGVRYTVQIRGVTRNLWLENGKDWFVEEDVIDAY